MQKASILARRLKLLEQATLTFAQYGLAHTTTEQISRACQVSTGTFFRHFPTKELLTEAVGAYVLQQLRQSTSCWPPGWQGTSDPLYDTLLGHWLGVAERVRQKPAYLLFWQQYRTSPIGIAQAAEPDWVLGPFQETVGVLLRQLLAPIPQALRPYPVSAELAGLLWLGQWTAVVTYCSAIPVAREQTDALLVAAFQAWWRGLGLYWEANFPRNSI